MILLFTIYSWGESKRCWYVAESPLQWYPILTQKLSGLPKLPTFRIEYLHVQHCLVAASPQITGHCTSLI